MVEFNRDVNVETLLTTGCQFSDNLIIVVVWMSLPQPFGCL